MVIQNKKGNLLTENILFITLNILFIAILLTFVFVKMDSTAVLEEKYAKEIALIIDSAKSGMIIQLEMEDATEKIEEGYNFNEIVQIKENIVRVQLKKNSGYEYSFFNDVSVGANFNTTSKKDYYFTIEEND